MGRIAKDQTVQYILTLLDGILQVDIVIGSHHKNLHLQSPTLIRFKNLVLLSIIHFNIMQRNKYCLMLTLIYSLEFNAPPHEFSVSSTKSLLSVMSVL